MNDQIPDFEPPAPMFEDPKPAKKPRKKPTKRMKRRIPVAAVVPKKRVAKKRRIAKRRGRPAGVPNKPKDVVVVPEHSEAHIVLSILGQMIGFDAKAKQRILAKLGELT